MTRLAMLVYVAIVFCTSPLLALEPAFTLQQGVLSYGSSTSKTTPDGGSAATTKDSSLTTMPNNLLIYATLEKMAFYVYPTQKGTPVAIGYYFLPELEVGLNLALNSAKMEK